MLRPTAIHFNTYKNRLLVFRPSFGVLLGNFYRYFRFYPCCIETPFSILPSFLTLYSLILYIPQLISGNLFADVRGSVAFINAFDMHQVVRMYRITHHDATVLRAWQGHRIEHKWFHAAVGRWVIHTVQPDNWITPSRQESVQQFLLNVNVPSILIVPGGNITAIRAIDPDSVLMIFSDMNVEASNADDYRFPSSTWDELSFGEQ